MATQGPLFPVTVTTESVLPEDDNNWTDPGNIAADDNAEAQITAATYDANDISFRLKAQNFGFTIPSDATINGITVEVAQRRFAGAAVDNRVQLLDAAGALVGDNKATATAWPGVETNTVYGGGADTWNAAPTPAMVNDPDFGVVISVKATAANTDIGVDYIRVTITYTPNPIQAADLNAAGVATVSGVGGAIVVTPLSAAGVAASALTSAAIFNALLEAAGVASMQGVGAALALAEWSAAGVGVMLAVGEDAGSGGGEPLAAFVRAKHRRFHNVVLTGRRMN